MKISNLVISVALGILLYGKSSNAQVVINEYSCANLHGFVDNYDKSEDWIELYNTGDAPVDLSGYYLSDRTSKPKKWRFPSIPGAIIPSHGYKIIWASNRDTAFGTFFHTNFALKQTKIPNEQIVFSGPTGLILDSVNISPVQLEHSTGRITNGAAEWGIFTAPTPGATNNNATTVRYAARPVFNKAPGFYSGQVTVAISSTETGGVIRYTLNGNEPVSSSPIYTTPIVITQTKVLKAKVFSPISGVLPSFLEYATYFINVTHRLPVVSVTGNQLTALVNGDQMLKPYGTIEYFDKHKKFKGNSTGEFNSHGKDSWACDQRSIDFIARDEMGENYALQVQYIPYNTRSEYQRVLLRASGDDNYPCGHNSSNDGSAHMRDGYIHNLAKKGGLHLDVRACERMVMYVNGAYWGVYEIRENPDDHDYTKYYYNQDKYHIQYMMVWGSTWAEYGGEQTLADWQTMYDYIVDNDMTVPENYAHVDSLFNIKSFVDYILVNSFTVCSDWLNWNVGWWRGLNPNGSHKKWGYILWDNDATFAFYINYTGIPDTSATALPCNPEGLTNPSSDPEGHITILNKLNQNPVFHQYYVNRQADLLNTAFSCDTMLDYLNHYEATIDPEMAMHAQRWYGTYAEWKANVQRLRYFIERRCVALQSGVSDCYNLSGPYDLTINTAPEGSGKIKINSVEIANFPWTGKYYGDINTVLKIYPNDTSTFINWSSKYHTFSPNDTNIEVVISLTEIDTVLAHFVQSSIIDPNENRLNVSVYPTVITNELTVDYYLPTPEVVNLDLYNLSGQKIAKLIPPTKYHSPGQYTVKLNLSRTNLAPGTYIISFTTGKEKKTFKVVYLK